jgi:3-oxoacyl-(acyl-carrier-protein) synthase
MSPEPVIIAAAITLPADTTLNLPLEIKKYKALRLMSPSAKLTLMAIFQAITKANLKVTTHSPTRAVVISVGNYDPLPEELGTANSELRYPKLRKSTNPLWLLKTLPNMPASHFAILTQSGGPSHTVATNTQAQQLASELILSGEADTVISADLPTITATIFTTS